MSYGFPMVFLWVPAIQGPWRHAEAAGERWTPPRRRRLARLDPAEIEAAGCGGHGGGNGGRSWENLRTSWRDWRKPRFFDGDMEVEVEKMGVFVIVNDLVEGKIYRK